MCIKYSMKFSKINRNDIILIAVLLCISLVALLIFSLTKTEGGYAVVTIDGTEVATYPLNQDTEVTLTYNNDFNILVIKDKAAKIKDATCPDKLCVHQGDVMFNGETLVCLPNKISVMIVSETDPDVDLIS